MPRFTFLPLATLTALALTATLLSSCSQAAPETVTDDSVAAASPTPSAAPRVSGARVDSLDGIPGHHFGEPLRNFPNLILLTKEDAKGVRVYQMPAGQERGWFGKHAKDVDTYYQFQDGQFAMFRAVTTNTDANRTALLAEARYLFGPNKNHDELTGQRTWEGERVLVQYVEKITTPQQCWLEVYSKPLLAVQRVKQQAQLQAENALGKQ